MDLEPEALKAYKANKLQFAEMDLSEIKKQK